MDTCYANIPAQTDEAMEDAVIARLNEDYLSYTTASLSEPAVYLLNCENNDIIILRGEYFTLFKGAMNGLHPEVCEAAYHAFKAYGFLIWE